MAELILEWVEAGITRSERIQPNQPSKSPGTVRLGRDTQRCDIVFADNSVSGLQAEILYNAANQTFYLRSLRDSNPPLINGQPISTGTEVSLGNASTINLGRLMLNAKTSFSAGAIPPTQVSSPGSNVPPTVVAPQAQYGASPPPPAYVSPPAYAPPPGFPVPNPAPVYSASAGADPQGPKIWVWLIAGALLIGGGAYAWPYVSDFLGITKEATVSKEKGGSSKSKQDQPSKSSNDDSKTKDDSTVESMADLSTYTHSSGLFQIKTPKDWQREDKSKSGTVAVLWSAEDGDSAITVDLTTSNDNINYQELDRRTRDFLQETYGQEPEFDLGRSTRLDNDGVKVDWSTSTKDGKLLGSTYSEQLENKVSVMQLLVLESNLDKVDQTLADIRTSYRIDPSVDIP